MTRRAHESVTPLGESEVPIKAVFSPRQVARLIGISYRQIQYWDKTNFIRPSQRARGKYRLYSFPDLVLIKLAKLMRERAVSIQRLRRIMRLVQDLLPKINYPLSDCHVLIDGERILIFKGDVVMDPGSSRSLVHFDAQKLRDDILRLWEDPASTLNETLAQTSR